MLLESKNQKKPVWSESGTAVAAPRVPLASFQRTKTRKRPPTRQRSAGTVPQATAAGIVRLASLDLAELPLALRARTRKV